jgi:hypothetical protein
VTERDPEEMGSFDPTDAVRSSGWFLAIGAAALVVVVFVGSVVFVVAELLAGDHGYGKPWPEFPTLAAEPNPSFRGTVAFIAGPSEPRKVESDGQVTMRKDSCAMVVRASGGRAQQVARESRMIGYRDLGVFRLFSLDGQWAQLEEFVIETLGPLISYDHEHGSELVRTLDAYLRRNGSLNQLAEVLVIHRSTLTYRLRRIRELLDVDIDDSSLRLELSLAARAVEVLYATAGHNVLLNHLQGLDVPLSVANGFLE